MFGVADSSLNAKALKARQQLLLKELRDLNGHFSSSLFLVVFLFLCSFVLVGLIVFGRCKLRMDNRVLSH